MPQYTDKQIEELIRTAGRGFALSGDVRVALKTRLLAVIKSGETRISTRYTFNPRRFSMPLIPIIIAVIIALGGGTASLANSAKPGDTLYPIDQLVEQIREKLATGPEARTQLLAQFADERVAELAEIEKVDPAKLTEAAKQRWEEHRQEAIGRVTTSIAKVTANQDKFKERLAAETDAAKKAIWQKIVAHLDEVKAKREARLTELQSKTFPGLPLRALKEELIRAREAHKQELEQIREQVKQEWEKIRENRKQEGSDNNSLSSSSTVSNSTDLSSIVDQTALEFRAPRDENGNIDWDLIDADHDGIPDKNDKNPNWPPHTMSS
ncbi:MAG: DUF5667 domain-containing protein [bacterium]